MKKILVTGKSLLVDPLLRVDNVVEPFRPAVVFSSAFMNSKIANGDVVLVSTLPDAATDAAWFKFYIDSDKDVELAKDAFVASFSAEPDVQLDAETIEAELAAKALADAEALAQAEAAAKAQAEAAAKAQAEAAAKAEAEAAAKAEAEAAAKAEAEAKALAEANAKKGK